MIIFVLACMRKEKRIVNLLHAVHMFIFINIQIKNFEDYEDFKTTNEVAVDTCSLHKYKFISIYKISYINICYLFVENHGSPS